MAKEKKQTSKYSGSTEINKPPPGFVPTGTLKKYTLNFIEKYFQALSTSKAKRQISEKLGVKKFVKKYMGNN